MSAWREIDHRCRRVRNGIPHMLRRRLRHGAGREHAQEPRVSRRIAARPGLVCSSRGQLRLARQLSEPLSTGCFPGPDLLGAHDSGSSSCRHAGLRLARMHLAGLGSQRSVPFPLEGRLRIDQRLKGKARGCIHSEGSAPRQGRGPSCPRQRCRRRQGSLTLRRVGGPSGHHRRGPVTGCLELRQPSQAPLPAGLPTVDRPVTASAGMRGVDDSDLVAPAGGAHEADRFCPAIVSGPATSSSRGPPAAHGS